MNENTCSSLIGLVDKNHIYINEGGIIVKKRVFISFAIEDVRLRDLLVGQARNDNSPFEFIDMSVKKPWDSEWKTNCKTKIKGCDGMIAIITKNTKKASGELWEIKCAKEEGIPHIGIWGYSDDHLSTIHEDIKPIRIINWTWSNISKWLEQI